ncbi:MAG: hypothetical protein V1888_02960 [archaeon]
MNKIFVVILILIAVSLVSSSDNESMVGFFGDEELSVNYVGDEENGFGGGDFIAPRVSINSPSNGVTYASSPVFFNVSLNEAGACNYSVNSGVSNSSMSASGLSFIATREMTSGSYMARFYCVDSAGNLNSSESVSFVVSIYVEPGTPGSGGGGGGGGGGGVATIIPGKEIKLDVDSENFKIRSVIGDKKNREFSVRNDGNESVVVVLSVEGEDVEMANGELVAFSEFVVLGSEVLNLDAGEEASVEFSVVAPDSLGIFVGNIVLEVGNARKEIPLSISTQSKETIFDVSSTVIDEHIQGAEDVRVQVDLLPVGERGIDITLRYAIKDFKGKVYFENSETFYVDGPMSFVKEFPTNNLNMGNYVVAVEMIYLGGFASSSSQFEVVDESVFGEFRLTLGNMFLIGVILIIILIGVIILLKLKKISNLPKSKKNTSGSRKRRYKK